MKTFIDPEEKFLIEIPTDWYFTTAKSGGDKAPYIFEPYIDQELAFQISIKPKPENSEGSEIQPAGSNHINFIEDGIPGLQLPNMKSWHGIVGDKLIIITLTHNPQLDQTRIAEELAKAENSKQTFILLDHASREKVVPKVRWNNLLLAHAASLDLSNRAFNNGSNLELVVLLANQIDSMLRQAIILKIQLQDQSDTIDVGLIHQKENDRPIMEKSIYKKALSLSIIDNQTHQLLSDLYVIRNKSVHRFIISDLRTDDIIQLVWSYSQLISSIGVILKGLEKEQFEKQIGLFKGQVPPDSPVDSKMFDELISVIRDKHGNRRLNEDITIGK
jgi:hypothetical protein